jgi:hypothetical protein
VKGVAAEEGVTSLAMAGPWIKRANIRPALIKPNQEKYFKKDLIISF